MTQFSSDLFTGASDTSLVSHTSDSSHSWAYSGIGNSSPSTPAKIFSNALSFSSSSGEHVPYYSSATPAAPEYSVTCTVNYNGSTADLSGPLLGVAATSVAGSSHGYLWHISPQSSGFRLRRYDGATPTNLATPTGTITSGVSYVMTIERAASGLITARVQRLSDNYWMNSSGTWGASQVNAASVTDTTYTAADRPGISTYAGTSWSTIDNFSADEVSGAQTLTPGLFTNTNSYYSPTVTLASGTQTLTPALYSNTNTFYAATVALATATQTLTPARFDNSGTFYAATVSTIAGFTTPVLKNNAGTVLSGETGVVCNVYNATTGALVVRKTGLTSSGAGIVTVSDAAIVSGTTYSYEIVLTAARRLPVAVAA